MKFLKLAALLPLIPFVTADVHKLKLQKLPPAQSSPELEALYLAEKYGGRTPQSPLLGAGGAGRASDR
ncbi:hypothetical protein MPER_12434, partial [Moniliophthora perniciosa FA553]